MIKPLILASSSINRFGLLKRLQVDFEVLSPNVDESILDGEKASDLVLRLAEKKAKSVYGLIQKRGLDEFWIIGSDQVLEVEGQIFGKPHTTEKALKQLSFFSGKTALFHTSVCLWLPAVIIAGDRAENLDLCLALIASST